MKETLARRAYEQLRQKLARGEIEPGTRLVNRTLAKELGVSFTPIREAINQLASEGLVEYVRGGGAFVRRLDRQDLAQLYDVRETLEPFAVAEAAHHITSYEMEELQEICDEWLVIARELRGNLGQTANREQALRWAENEERFHKVLIEASRNRWLAKIGMDLLIAAQAFGAVREEQGLLTLSIAASTWRQHAQLLRILRRRDSVAAHAWMVEHIRVGRRYVLGFLREIRGSVTN